MGDLFLRTLGVMKNQENTRVGILYLLINQDQEFRSSESASAPSFQLLHSSFALSKYGLVYRRIRRQRRHFRPLPPIFEIRSSMNLPLSDFSPHPHQLKPNFLNESNLQADFLNPNPSNGEQAPKKKI